MEHVTLKTDVLIVGAGPVGLILANILKRNGLNMILIDKHISKPSAPRGIAINQATLDIFATLGLKNIFDSGLIVENINLYWKQKYLGQFNFKDSSLEHPYFFHITQNVIEKHLENDLLKLGLRINRGTELITYTQNESSIHAQVREEGSVFSIQADFLIGCDGGHSRVREIMACGVDQREYGPSFVLADVTFENYKNSNSNYIFTEQGYLMIVPLPEKKYRLIFSTQPNSPLKAEHYLSDKSNLQQLFNERFDKEIKISTIFWATHAKYGHRISNQIYQNRVVLAGDALHQFSPVGGTNMNVGIQDAFALGWRLINAINNSSSMSHLSEYEAERKEIIQKQQNLTEWITALITRSKNYPLENNFNSINNFQTIKGYLTGLLGANNRKHLQNFINYQEIKDIASEIRHEFSKANYVLFSSGIVTRRLSEKIKRRIQNNQFLTWIHNSSEDSFKFLFCRPDAIVTLSGDVHDIDQLFNTFKLGVIHG